MPNKDTPLGAGIPTSNPPQQTTTPPSRDNSTADYPGHLGTPTDPNAPTTNGLDQTFTKDDFTSYFKPTDEGDASDTVLDINQLEYSALAILPDGSTVDLSPCIETFTWDELKGEWAMRFSLTLRDTSTARGQISDIIALGGKVSFWWRLGGGTPGPAWNPIGLGTCWDWEYVDDGLPSINGTLYDDLMPLMKSDCLAVFWPPFLVRDAIFQLIKDWQIPLSVDSSGNVNWDGPPDSTVVRRRMKLSGSIADGITQLLAEAFITEKTPYGYGQEYFPRIEFDGQGAGLAIRKPGTNTPIWTFAPFQATSNIHVKWSMEDLITQLKVTGSDGQQSWIVSGTEEDQNQNNWGPITFTVNGAYPELGLIRRIQVASAGDVPDVLELQAQSEMAYYGAPMRTFEFTTFDNPATRRGDTIFVRGVKGIEDGTYHLVGVQHMPATRQMRLQGDSSGMFDHRRKSFDMILQNVVSPDAATTANPDGTQTDDSSLTPADASSPPPNSDGTVPVDTTPFIEAGGRFPPAGVTGGSAAYRVADAKTVQIEHDDGSWTDVPGAQVQTDWGGQLLADAKAHGYNPDLNSRNPAPPRT